MKLSSKQIYLRRLQAGDVKSLLALRLRNRQFLQPFEPLNSDSHYTIEAQEMILERVHLDWENQSGYGFGVFLNANHCLIGRVNLSNVVLGTWESCTIGYYLDEEFNGRGLTTEAVCLAVKFAFEIASLHRVQGAVMPRNIGSNRVLEKVGFRYEGFSEYYLKINGNWEHHNIYSITREYWDTKDRVE